MTVEALRRRRPEALGDLLGTYGRELQAVAYLITRDRADAEDVVVETLLTAFDKAGSHPRRACAAGLAAAGRHEPRAAAPPEPGAGRAAACGAGRAGAGGPRRHSDDRVVLMHGLADLPPRTRAAVVLRYYADLPVDDVAATLGKSPNTIKTQLRRRSTACASPSPTRSAPASGRPAMPDTSFDDRLRSALPSDADAQPFTIIGGRAGAPAAARRRRRNGQRLTLMAAGIADGRDRDDGRAWQWLAPDALGGRHPAGEPVADRPALPRLRARPDAVRRPDTSPAAPVADGQRHAAPPHAADEPLACTSSSTTTGVIRIGGPVHRGRHARATPWRYGSDPDRPGASARPAAVDPDLWEAPDGVDRPSRIPAQTTSKLQFLGAEQLYCITGVSAEAAPGERRTRSGPTITLPPVTQAPAATIELAPPAVGTWRIRVTVQYATDGRGRLDDGDRSSRTVRWPR